MRGITMLMLLLLWTQDGVKCIRLVELRVPAHAAAGGEALLGCQFDMEGETLYSVKWYKDDREFYRYVPGNYRIPIQYFARPGVSVDVSRSSSDVVTLTDLNPHSEGVYRCEVSGEAPRFAMAADDKQIVIHVLPESGPIVTGLRNQYQIGDRIAVNCTSPGSRPQARLKWLVNERMAPKRNVQGPWTRKVDEPLDTTETILQLKFMVMPNHFKDGVMTIKCQATIAPLYQRETVHTATQTDYPAPESEPQTADVDDEISQQITHQFQEISRTTRLDKYDDLLADTADHGTKMETWWTTMIMTLLLQVLIIP